MGEESMPSGGMNYMPTILASEKASLFDKIRPEEIVEEIKQRLMGKEYDPSSKKWIKPSWSKKGLTELGASEIATLMLPTSSKNVVISKLNDQDIRAMTKRVHATAVKMCLANWREYGIDSPDQIMLVSDIVKNNTFITLKQPENAGTREMIKGTTQESIIKQDSVQPRSGVSALFRR